MINFEFLQQLARDQEFWTQLGVWLLALFYILALINCFRLVMNRQSPGATLAWIIINMFVPFVGVPLFYLFGTNRLPTFVKRPGSGVTAATSATAIRTKSEALPEQPDALAHEYGQIFSRYGHMFDPHLNSADLLRDGEETFTSIFSALSKAESYILVQYYILRSDRLGRELQKVLIEKARAGIPVYMLIDDLGSFWIKGKYLKDLIQAGVKVSRFLPPLRRPFMINFRNHRKSVIVDGKCAYTGGLNIGDEYIGKASQFSHWRDTHVKVTGPAVAQLQDSFAEDWLFATKKDLALKLSSGPYPKPKEPRCHVQVLPTGPTDHDLIAVYLFLQLICTAKKRLWISTPYFVPDYTFLHQLELAAMRGVDVRILIPGVTDHRLIYWVSLANAEKLIDKGIRVFTYQKGFMHQKLMVIDDSLTVCGTNNFDNRSLYLNFETTMLIFDHKINREAESMMEDDFKNSQIFQPKPTRFGYRLEQLRANFVRIFSPLF